MEMLTSVMLSWEIAALILSLITAATTSRVWRNRVLWMTGVCSSTLTIDCCKWARPSTNAVAASYSWFSSEIFRWSNSDLVMSEKWKHLDQMLGGNVDSPRTVMPSVQATMSAFSDNLAIAASTRIWSVSKRRTCMQPQIRAKYEKTWATNKYNIRQQQPSATYLITHFPRRSVQLADFCVQDRRSFMQRAQRRDTRLHVLIVKGWWVTKFDVNWLTCQCYLVLRKTLTYVLLLRHGADQRRLKISLFPNDFLQQSVDRGDVHGIFDGH